MKKVLETERVLTTFEGEPMRLGEAGGEPARLRDVLLVYLRNGAQMGLSEMEQSAAYEAGLKIGRAEGRAELTQGEYDVVKKLADSGRITGPGGEGAIFGLEVSGQIKRLVDGAETVEI